MFNAELATEIGLNEAIFLQQVHYWLTINEEVNRNFKDGRYWTYNTYDEWIEKYLPFWSKSTLRRTIKSLEEQKLLIADNFNKAKFDKTKWLTIDYEKLKEVEDKVYNKEESGQNEQRNAQDEHSSVQNEQTRCSKWTAPSVQNEQNNTIDLPKTTTKITTQHGEDSKKNNKSTPQKDNQPAVVENYILSKIKRASLAKEYLIIEDLKQYSSNIIKKACDLAIAAQESRGNYRQGDAKNGVDISSYKFIRCFIAEAEEILNGGANNGSDKPNNNGTGEKDYTEGASPGFFIN